MKPRGVANPPIDMDPNMTQLPDARFLHRLADAADAETMQRFRTRLDVQSKPKDGYKFDPVTDADRAAEIAIRAIIRDAYPDHAIEGEEFGVSGSGDIRWVIDPIDGTRPFLLGIPVWGTLVGVTEKGHAVSGMMSQPVTRERFWADRTGSWMQRDSKTIELKTSEKVDLADAILHTNSPEPILRNPQISFEALNRQVKMTRYGGECYAFAMLAAGHIDICFEFSLQPYDIVAIIPIIEKAGGVVTTLSGGNAAAGGPVVVAANSSLHAQVLKILNG